MFKIYPKTNVFLAGIDKFENVIREYKGIEIQCFDENDIMEDFDFESGVIKAKELFKELEEITIHTPLESYELEAMLLKDYELVKNQMLRLVKLSNDLGIHINYLFHSKIKFNEMQKLFDIKIREMLKILEGSNVTLLFENLFFVGEKNMSVLEYVAYIDHPNFRVCFDLCHAYCKVHMYKAENIEYLDTYLNKEKCEKYVKQVHFSYTRNNDGYIDKMTHGRCHDYIESMEYDLNILKRYGMDKANLVVEVAEDDEDYNARKNQLSEIKMLYKVLGKEF